MILWQASNIGTLKIVVYEILVEIERKRKRKTMQRFTMFGNVPISMRVSS